MSALIDDELVDAVKAAVAAEAQDTADGKPIGCVIAMGCEKSGYVDPQDAASKFIDALARAALAVAVPAIGARCIQIAHEVIAEEPGGSQRAQGIRMGATSVAMRVGSLTQETKP